MNLALCDTILKVKHINLRHYVLTNEHVVLYRI
jgi:hypothetical protein